MTKPRPSTANRARLNEPRFDLIRKTFAANFATRGEIGAGVAVYLDGKPVVDLWGGHVIHDGKPAGPW